ncbi:ATP-binding protein [Planococcus sp. YIM B11945]|uniref:ATP-binding protein n=1 Tax=Planococcus sp. YIM B11945 TaxID=3435410 RepID=UPI003D7C5EC4
MTALMVVGLFIVNPRYDGTKEGFYIHLALAVLLTIAVFVYPTHERPFWRRLIIVLASAYFYAIFFLYPETWSTFIFLCFIPALSILFFDAKLFYFSLVFNFLLILLTFSYIMLIDQGTDYAHIKLDIIGNCINFIGSQAILFLIFHLTSDRIKKQQIYYEELQQAERLTTTGQLAAAIAHEIRNPLTVVSGFLQFYEQNDAVNKEMKSKFSLMIDELNTAEHVISQFLDIAKPDENHMPEAVDVRKTLHGVADLLMSYGVFHQHRIEVQAQENLHIQANTIEFKQLIINLVKNAIEASREGEGVVISAIEKKKFVEIRIIDTGFGMTEEEVKSAGTPFYSLKSKGTGLGLMICFNIVEKFGGTIDIQSEKGKGTTVTICFPAAMAT